MSEEFRLCLQHLCNTDAAMAFRIDKVAAREALKPRHEPYWQRIRKGCYLGYRKKGVAGAGAWIARYRDDATGERSIHSLGAIDDRPEGERFDVAREAAEEWFRHMGDGGTSKAKTVEDACRDYVEHLRASGRRKAADDADGRFRRFVNEAVRFA